MYAQIREMCVVHFRSNCNDFFVLQTKINCNRVVAKLYLKSSIYIKLRFCLYIGPNHATFWLRTFQTKLWTKTPSTKFLSVCLSLCLSVCMYVCMFPWVPRKDAHDSLKNGCWDHYEISYLDQISSNLHF